ncbi:Prephenate dehydratase [Desulfofarcimen acetoxidans DSM 771]|uniref:Prephenate dehydratase n=1 Tax=Desulfofarcimen acetoxidans (strain ATCC 49208 / DSM 771 / KCTC 5769 / VKM B-1644 / 5575) TaxID=485916 RepID=C8W332_DESAS|nr:prephenate dehydratase [Desulfofarcimen acetoxidans]ACV61799.1 Prephenate dehydratase [Desulfofarcimen acetoxidans DSM 771]
MCEIKTANNINKIAYLGPIGTFCEEAACKFTMREQVDWQLLPCGTIVDVFNSVYRGEVDLGIVPIENSCEGSVNQTLDLLANEFDLKITGEIILPVQQNLISRQGVELTAITRVLSHPQALAQCREYLEGHLPGAEPVEIASTAEAARQVALSGEVWAAIGTAGAAAAYGLAVLVPAINDYSNNETRFVLLSRFDSDCFWDCKTSLLVYVLNQPGALSRVLGEFSLRGINLTKIESRPTRKKIGEYFFFIDIEGHRLEPKVKEALEEIRTVAQAVRVLGTYRSAVKVETAKRSVFEPTLDDLRQEIDMIDDQIIELLGRRTRTVDKVGNFKKVGSVRDPERESRVLEKLRKLAEIKGFDPDVISKVYRILFDHFVSLQQKKVDSGQ